MKIIVERRDSTIVTHIYDKY